MFFDVLFSFRFLGFFEICIFLYVLVPSIAEHDMQLRSDSVDSED